MALPYVVQFVDRITATPTLRLDVAATWIVGRDSDLSPPVLERAYAGSMLVDGRPVTAASYGNRVITLALKLRDESASEDQAAAAVQALAQELDRPGNILRWQPGTTQPVFFRTLRGEFGRVYWDAVQKRAVVSIPAEPFAYGVREAVSPVTVQNNPASGNGCYFDVTGVKGDVETPLIVALANGATNTSVRRTSVFAVRRRGTPSALPLARQVEALTVGTDTTAQPNDALFSGSGSNFVRTTFATNTAMVTRASGFMTAASPNVDLRGTYRVFLRVRHSVSTDVIRVQLRWGFSTFTANDAVTLGNGASASFTELHYYDLGLVQCPVGADPVTDGFSGVEMPPTSPQVFLQAQRVSGSGNLDMDHLLFVPADDRLLLVRWPTGNVYSSVLDGANEMTYDADVAGGTMTLGVTEPSEISGGFPMVSPRATNRIVFIRDAVARDFGSDAISGSTVVTPAYYPRYLYVRPAAS